jgi:hypothetical protein
MGLPATAASEDVELVGRVLVQHLKQVAYAALWSTQRQPALIVFDDVDVTATLRGMALVRVQVDTLEGNLHSGQFGGAAPDAFASRPFFLCSSTLNPDSRMATAAAAAAHGVFPERPRWPPPSSGAS